MLQCVAQFPAAVQVLSTNQQIGLNPEHQAIGAEVVCQAADLPHAFGDWAECAKVWGDHMVGAQGRGLLLADRGESLFLIESRQRAVLIHVGRWWLTSPKTRSSSLQMPPLRSS